MWLVHRSSRAALRTCPTIRHCRTTVGQNVQLLWKQTDFDSAVGRCLVSDENSAWKIPIRHDTLSDDDVTVCLPHGSASNGEEHL